MFYSGVCVCVCVRAVSRWCWQHWSLTGSWLCSLSPAGFSGFCWPRSDSAAVAPADPPGSSIARLAPSLSSAPYGEETEMGKSVKQSIKGFR